MVYYIIRYEGCIVHAMMPGTLIPMVRAGGTALQTLEELRQLAQQAKERGVQVKALTINITYDEFLATPVSRNPVSAPPWHLIPNAGAKVEELNLSELFT